jgi:hypothetical protein
MARTIHYRRHRTDMNCTLKNLLVHQLKKLIIGARLKRYNTYQ